MFLYITFECVDNCQSRIGADIFGDKRAIARSDRRIVYFSIFAKSAGKHGNEMFSFIEKQMVKLELPFVMIGKELLLMKNRTIHRMRDKRIPGIFMLRRFVWDDSDR